jgi:signal transduction histidine kinase/DNA-binding response OmpR family regulator
MPDERVLVADDEASVLDMCIRALSMEGYLVSGVTSGQAAIELARSQPFDLLVTDIRMPTVTGLQAFQTIREHSPDIVGIVITAHGAVDTAIEALKLGMYDFLLKPFSLDELSTTVARALEQKRVTKENARLKALIPLFQVSQAFGTMADLRSQLYQVVLAAVQETAAHMGILVLRSEASQDYQTTQLVHASGVQPSTTAPELSPALLSQVATQQQAILWQATTSPYPLFASSASVEQPLTGAVLPLTVKGELLGVLALTKGQWDTAFTDSDMGFLSVLASQAATSVQNSRLLTRIGDMYAKLSILDHLKSEFINLAAHELRTPMAEIKAYLALIEQQGNATETPHYAAITRAATRLEQLVNQMTDLSFLEANEVELQPTTFSLAQVVASLAEQTASLTAARGQSLVVQIPPDFPLVHADAPKVKMILENLLVNAIDFTPREGTITIGAAVRESELRVWVSDTGIGIPRQEWEWVFKPFYQLESSLLRERGGIGAGLSIAKKLVELHDGSIWLESTVGQGSTFTFALPHSIAPDGA